VSESKSSRRVALDTNAVIAILADDQNALLRLEEFSTWLLPVVVYGELLYGVYASMHVKKNLQSLTAFANLCTMLQVDSDTALYYGKLQTELRFEGTPIPVNDAWIAALCRQHDCALLSRDVHFDVVERLSVLAW
jgi:tRNA(fMet)-specific endonuclease VapC